MAFEELIVDLRLPPAQRWHLSAAQRTQARELFAIYKEDLGRQVQAADLVVQHARPLVRPDHWAEMEALADALDLPLGDVVLCNLYYDLLKVVIGCTAFAVATPGGVLHGRNLDWRTRNAALNRYTAVTRFIGAPAGEFVVIGWPGYVGVFSAVAKGRFAITLNAVLSLEPAQIATPIVFLIRTVLEECRTFDDALQVLAETPIASDCLLLLSGPAEDQLAVIERTPTRHAIRRSAEAVSVANDYRRIDADTGSASSELLATSRGRLARVEALLSQQLPEAAADCLRYLSDPGVRMGITVQQMVFRPATGDYWLQLPDIV